MVWGLAPSGPGWKALGASGAGGASPGLEAIEVDPPRSVSVIREKDDDNRILECALSARAHYLVSGDRRHLLPLRKFRGVSIVTPAEVMELLLRNRSIQ